MSDIHLVDAHADAWAAYPGVRIVVATGLRIGAFRSDG